MTPVDIRVLHPLASYSALYVVAQVAADDDVRGFANLLDALDGDGKADVYEGIYLELRDSSGQTLVADGIDKLTGAGTYWEKPGLDVATGINHG